ncbi:MAG: serine--tRNA ligase [Acidimicrobiia bacterium]|nr:MAG: serine--tRNA ligase [Acidimicrobiia bacterium]
MIDVAILRDDPGALEAGLERRGVRVDVAALGALDVQRRAVRAETEELRARQKEGGKAIAGLDGADKDAAIAAAAELADQYKEMLSRADALDNKFMATWVTIPNLADDTAADGFTEEDYEEIRRWGTPPAFGFEPRDHVDLGAGLGVIDIERATKISGSRFGIIKGRLAMLEFALVRWAFDVLGGHGFEPVVPPVLVREEALFGTGFFPADREQVYSVGEDDLYLVGTSEVPLAAMHGDEFLEREDLPIRYVGFSTCFRVEAGTYGKDTRGIFRVHQFDKMEMFSFVHPESSRQEHDFLLAREEELIQALGIPYRVVNVSAGDLGASAAKKYDIEGWFPGQDRYRELTSTSNTTDYQARRLGIRFKDENGKRRLVHTLNGTVFAVGRTLIAIMENLQTADGSVIVPEVLRPYAGFDVIE